MQKGPATDREQELTCRSLTQQARENRVCSVLSSKGLGGNREQRQGLPLKKT